MLSIFKDIPDRQPPRIPPKLNNVKQVIHENHKRIVEFWRGMNWAVRSDHILVAMLTQIPDIISENPLDIYRHAQDTMEQYTAARGIGSSITYSRIQPRSYFFGANCQEVLISQPFDDAIDQVFSKHYTEWETLRIVTHPFTTFDFQLANGKQRKSGESGLCVIKMDLALMFAQYKLWSKDKFRCMYEDGTPKSIMNFIHSYPIVSLLRTQTDRAWYNRLFNISEGLPNMETREDTRLFMSNPYINVDEILTKLDYDIKRSRNNFHDWICWVPGIFSKNLKQHLIQDTVLETQQNKLPWALGWFSTLHWLFKLEHDIETHASTKYTTEYLRKYKEYMYGRTFGTIRGLKYDTVLEAFTNEINAYM